MDTATLFETTATTVLIEQVFDNTSSIETEVLSVLVEEAIVEGSGILETTTETNILEVVTQREVLQEVTETNFLEITNVIETEILEILIQGPSGPQGDKGDKGDKGDQGVPGDPGVTNGEITGETPVGALDGMNATFTTASEFIPDSVKVYLNGVRQTQLVDFNTSGLQIILMSQSPLTGEYLRVDYILN